MFKAMDTDNSGVITFDELKAGLRKYGSTLKDTEIRDLMDACLLVQQRASCVASDVDTDLQLSGPGLSAHYFGNIGLKPENQSTERKRIPSKRKRNDELA